MKGDMAERSVVRPFRGAHTAGSARSAGSKDPAYKSNAPAHKNEARGAGSKDPAYESDPAYLGEALGGKNRVARIMRRLSRAIVRFEEPAVEKIAETQHDDPYQVLIATLLSAQTRDAVTAAASARLFSVARTPHAVAKLSTRQIEKLIYPVSFYRHKAVHVKQTSDQIMRRYAGVVPSTMEELLTLPGVGRKTANLVLILAHRSRQNICVDTHVHRISNRLGWVTTKTPDDTEQALYRATDRKWWPVINLYLVTWGQNVCRPVYPVCGSCAIHDLCPRIGVQKVGKST